METYRTITDVYRQKFRAAIRNKTDLPLPKKIGFGIGGYNTDTHQIIAPSASAVAMDNPYDIRDFYGIYEDGDYLMLLSMIGEQEYSGYGISQIGVFDDADDLILLINFAEQIKYPGTILAITIRFGY